MSLPPLLPVLEVFLSCLPKAPYRTGITEQIELYGQACRAAALEEAAKCAEDYPTYGEATAEEIRSLK